MSHEVFGRDVLISKADNDRREESKENVIETNHPAIKDCLP